MKVNHPDQDQIADWLLHPTTVYIRWLLEQDRQSIGEELGFGGVLTESVEKTALGYARRVGFCEGIGRIIEIIEDLSIEITTTETDRRESGREKNPHGAGY